MYSLTPYPITPLGNFLGIVLALLPLLSNIRKLSIAVWGFAIWIAILNIVNFVNSIIWHDNVNIKAPVWCDITTKLALGTEIGTRTCILLICIHLYKITCLHGPVEKSKKQKRRIMAYELSLIIGLPFLVMALWIIVQPFRFEIIEENGCTASVYSYVGYILQLAPALACNIGCALLAPLTLRRFFRHRKEMNEYLSSGRDMAPNRSEYRRLMAIACLDTFFNLPVLIVLLTTDILEGQDNDLNKPYISWTNVHDGDGGELPGSSLSTILQTTASEWSTDKWDTFTVKWNEWLYVLHAVIFFGVFGTTPEMRSYYRAAFWFIPRCLGFKTQKRISEVETISEVAFNSNPGQQVEDDPTNSK